MMRSLLLIWFLSLGGVLFAQEALEAEKEVLGSLSLGTGPLNVVYDVSEEGFSSPGSPFLDSRSGVIFYRTGNSPSFLRYSDSKFEQLPYRGNLDRNHARKGLYVSSQQGIMFGGWNQFVFSDNRIAEYDLDTQNVELGDAEYQNYPAPFGTILYSDGVKSGIAVVFDVRNAKPNFSVIDQNQLRSWLPKQPGGFSVGDDGSLYKNGILWSALRPTDSTGGTKFVGRLASGHLVWMGVQGQQEQYLVISNPQQKTELRVEIPWGGKTKQPIYMYDSALGPWGELYCLLPPEFVPTRESRTADGQLYSVYEPNPTGKAELVVVRNYLKYFGRLNDGGVRLRKDPTTTGEILGTYTAKTGFRILEKGTKEETIGGQKNVWYKVRLLDGKEGWFFGSFVQNLYDGPNGKAPPWPNVPDW